MQARQENCLIRYYLRIQSESPEFIAIQGGSPPPRLLSRLFSRYTLSSPIGKVQGA